MEKNSKKPERQTDYRQKLKRYYKQFYFFRREKSYAFLTKRITGI